VGSQTSLEQSLGKRASVYLEWEGERDRGLLPRVSSKPIAVSTLVGKSLALVTSAHGT
jgi:hypothetical protein